MNIQTLVLRNLEHQLKCHSFSQSLHTTVKSRVKVAAFKMLGKDGPSSFVLANTNPAYATGLHMLPEHGEEYVQKAPWEPGDLLKSVNMSAETKGCGSQSGVAGVEC